MEKVTVQKEEDSSKYSHLSIDDLLKYVGESGPFQWFINAIFFLMAMVKAIQVTIMYFATMTPSWTCKNGSVICNMNGTFSSDDISRCSMPRNDWIYLESPKYSIVTQFNIDCDQKWLDHLSTTIFFIGWGVGALVLGWIADSFGRMKVLMISYLALVGIPFISAFFTNIYVFVFTRFVVGFFIPGDIVELMMSEITGSKYRPLANNILFGSFTFASCVLCLTAYFIREWKYLFLVSTVPYILVILSFGYIPESIRWLKLNGNPEKSMDILKLIARWNKRDIPLNIELSVPVITTPQKKMNPFEIFRTKKLLLQSAVQGYAWFAMGTVYYGLFLAANHLGGDVYRDFIILALADIPSLFLSTYLTGRFGRKRTIITSLFIGGATCLAIAFVPNTGAAKIIRVVLGITGKMLTNVAFCSIYVWSSELYSTDVRSLGMGYLQLAARVGADSTPWITKWLAVVNMSAPFVLMGLVAMTASLLCVILPETRDKGLSEHINEQNDE